MTATFTFTAPPLALAAPTMDRVAIQARVQAAVDKLAEGGEAIIEITSTSPSREAITIIDEMRVPLRAIGIKCYEYMETLGGPISIRIVRPRADAPAPYIGVEDVGHGDPRLTIPTNGKTRFARLRQSALALCETTIDRHLSGCEGDEKPASVRESLISRLLDVLGDKGESLDL